MTTRTLIAKDMAHAMTLATQKYGKDVILISATTASGHVIVEVTSDPSYLLNAEQGTNLNEALGGIAHVPISSEDSDELSSDASCFDKDVAWRMGGAPWSDTHRVTFPWVKNLFDRFLALNIEVALARRLTHRYREISDEGLAWKLALSDLRRAIDSRSQDTLHRAGTFAFVGSSASGKTTAIGKVLTNFLRNGSCQDVVLLTVDATSVASAQFLCALGKSLNVRVEQVSSDDGTFQEILAEVSDVPLVLIDTPPLAFDHGRLTSHIRLKTLQSDNIETVFVLPADLQYSSMIETYRLMKEGQCSSCIVTRTGDVQSFGAVTSFLVVSSLPVAYFSNGASVAEPLESANSLSVLKRLLQLPQSRHDSIDSEAPVATGAFVETVAAKPQGELEIA
ncbi:MAG: hypothetical protein AB8B86_16265 [Pseudomonadales bacterium]